MKRILSVAMVAVRQTLWKLLLIAVLLAAVQVAGFWVALPEEVTQFDQCLGGFFIWSLRAAMVALFAVELYQGVDGSGNMGYTLRRLPMGERAATILWGLVHTVSYWILWAMELAVVLVCWRLYLMRFAIREPALELFTQFYRGEFLHGLLPLEDFGRAAANGLMFPALGFGAAFFGFRVRNGRKGYQALAVLLISMTAVPASFQESEQNGIFITCYLVALGYMLWRIGWGEYAED